MRIKTERERRIQEEYDLKKRRLEEERLAALIQLEKDRIREEKKTLESLHLLERDKRINKEIPVPIYRPNGEEYEPPYLFDQD